MNSDAAELHNQNTQTESEVKTREKLRKKNS